MFRLIVVSYPTPGSSPTPSATHGCSTPAAIPQEPSCSAPPIPRETTSVEVHNLPNLNGAHLRTLSQYAEF